MLIHNKDDIELVTEFPCFLGQPNYQNYPGNVDEIIKILYKIMFQQFQTKIVISWPEFDSYECAVCKLKLLSISRRGTKHLLASSSYVIFIFST